MENKPSSYLSIVLSSLDSVKYSSIIERAKNNGYHDFKFDTIPSHPEYADCICPKMQLVEDLSKYPELGSILQDVMDGVYDDRGDKEDGERIRGELMDGNTPDEFFKILGFDPPTTEEKEQRNRSKNLN